MIYALIDASGKLVRLQAHLSEAGKGYLCLPVDSQDMPPAVAAEILGIAKTNAIAGVNDATSRARGAYITVIPGQDATYQAKADEARRYADDPSPAPAAYQYLSLEAAAVGLSLADVAAQVSQVAGEWTGIDARIEAARRGGIVAIAAAATTDEVETLLIASVSAINREVGDHG